MKKILIPTDFSEQAENALKVAAQLAQKHHAEIYLLHTLELPMQKVDPLSSSANLPEAMYFMQLAHKHFETLLEKDYLKGINVHEIVEFYETFRGVYQVCKKHQIDLIVMGSHGTNSFREMLIGSNTEKVVRTSEVPVLVIKKEHPAFKINDFVFASNFKDYYQAPYKKATEFATLFDAKMHLLMVNTAGHFMTTHDAKERMHAFAKTAHFDNYSVNIYNDINVEKGIMNFSQSIKADLIGMCTHGRQGLSSFFNGSISEDLVNNAKRPVMTFKID
ncbi:MAG: universal stress protein [Flavobacteriales bacterium]|nr:universal stress protein [Flavobacteriia bacterium]NCP06095.1 universal stress protein [Flavobacteriales bacterium]PIV93963.1 MAG: universal stress protein UspA [Flavobacteriaceae bacterium CG17_big_fil_post_rev_8_21_14_2_50_33_15]NCP90885.1 universal stress protein [Flavobacteriales bacterium]NCQ15500.1 universal stress protein [Flavobacteriales bacterium]